MSLMITPDLHDILESDAPHSDRFSINAFALLRRGKLDARVRELVILRVAALSGSSCELGEHVPTARRAGATAEEIEAAASGRLDGIDLDLAVALRFVEECVRDVKVSDATFDGAQRRFSPQEIAELTILVGYHMLTARFHETLSVDVDPPVDALLLA